MSGAQKMTNKTTLSHSEWRDKFDMFMAKALTGIITLQSDAGLNGEISDAVSYAAACMAARGYTVEAEPEPVPPDAKPTLESQPRPLDSPRFIPHDSEPTPAPPNPWHKYPEDRPEPGATVFVLTSDKAPRYHKRFTGYALRWNDETGIPFYRGGVDPYIYPDRQSAEKHLATVHDSEKWIVVKIEIVEVDE